MKNSTEEIARRLTSSLGADAITTEAAQLAEHSIDGVTPALICTPATTEQLAEAVKICSDA